MGDGIADGSDDSGWASDVPITTPPTEFVFGVDRSSPTERDEPPPPSQRSWWPAAIVAVVLVGGIVTVAALREPSVDDAGNANSEPTDVGVPASPTAPEPSTAQKSLAEAEPGDEAEPSDDEPFNEAEPAAVWTVGDIELPDRIRAIDAPMQLVAVTSRGRYVEIDPATSTIDGYDLGRRLTSFNMVVGNTTAVLRSNDLRGPPLLIRRGQEPIEIDVERNAYIDSVTGNGDEYSVSSNNYDTGTQSHAVIRSDGSVTSGPDLDVGWRLPVALEVGGDLVLDAGGVYLESERGARRISTGLPLATSARHLLSRECDAERRCRLVVLDVATGDEREAVVPDDVDDDSYDPDAQLSPDGFTMLTGSDAAGEPIGLFVDLETGATVPAPRSVAGGGGDGSRAWAADSSGVFTLSKGEISFVDRSTGDVTAIPIALEEGDRVMDIGVRTPRRSPE